MCNYSNCLLGAANTQVTYSQHWAWTHRASWVHTLKEWRVKRSREMLDFVASTCFCPKYTQRPPILQWAAWRLILVAPGVTFLRRHTLNTLKPLTPPNIHLHGSLCDTPPHKHSHSIRGRSKHTSGADAAAMWSSRESLQWDFNERRSQTAVNSHANL